MRERPTSFAVRLAGAAALPEGESRAFTFQRRGHEEAAFVLRVQGRLVAYVNRCPHWNVDLDLGDERFYFADLDRITCKNHGATFLPLTGECDAGPCAGARLEALPLHVEGEDLVVAIPDYPILA